MALETLSQKNSIGQDKHDEFERQLKIKQNVALSALSQKNSNDQENHDESEHQLKINERIERDKCDEFER